MVALAEPHPERRQAMAREHALASEAVFDDWRDLLDRPRRAPLAIVATGDTLHVDPALAALERGYHLLLEKPIAPEPVGCVRVVEAAERAGRILQIGHVLRFTDFYSAAHEIVASGQLGELVHLELKEHVATWHMVHSFVRGKFRRREEAAPLLLAKSCHDLDLLVWLANRPPLRVASFGALSGYTPERAPAGAPRRCSDGCPVQESCPHDAVRFYLGPDEALARSFPWSDVSLDPSREARRRGLEGGPYGRCVYHCDNDVVDHQTVAVELAGGATAAFTVHGHATREVRTLRVTGTEGELRGSLESGELEISRHGAFELERRRFDHTPLGHYGGDRGLLEHVVEAVLLGRADARASGRTALAGHLLGFAAERARRRASVVDVTAFAQEVARAAGVPP